MGNKTGGPAFPIHEFRGMTLRDYFAAKAMQATMQSVIDSNGIKEALKEEGIIVEQYIADQAYIMADAMLAARGKP